MSHAWKKWQCIQNCGACCRLDPTERGEAIAVLNERQQEIYLGMVNPDGWCKHYDTGGRRCRIYNSRPDFCRVGLLASLFNLPQDKSESFAIQCCRQQIRSVYGGRSRELRNFERILRLPFQKDG